MKVHSTSTSNNPAFVVSYDGSLFRQRDRKTIRPNYAVLGA